MFAVARGKRQLVYNQAAMTLANMTIAQVNQFIETGQLSFSDAGDNPTYIEEYDADKLEGWLTE